MRSDSPGSDEMSLLPIDHLEARKIKARHLIADVKPPIGWWSLLKANTSTVEKVDQKIEGDSISSPAQETTDLL